MAEADPRLAIGANGPPPPTPYEAIKLNIDDLYDTAQGFLDGAPILTQEQADDVGRIMGEARAARTAAEEQRKKDAKPFDDGKAAVQALWTPLTDDKKGRCALIVKTCQRALEPFLDAKEAAQKAEAAKARAEAEALQRAAMEALRVANASDLAAREEAERLLKDASKADKAANRAEKAKPMAAGTGRSVSLRSNFIAVLTDSVAALKYYREHQPEALREWLREQAQRDVNAGKREIPGIAVNEERIAQ